MAEGIKLGSFADFQEANPGASYPDYDAALTENKRNIARAIGTTVPMLEDMTPSAVQELLAIASQEEVASA